MPQLNADRYVAEIGASTAGLAEILAEYDQSLPIPTCPEWTLRQLVTHVGRAHRWAAEITRTRSDAFIPFREVPDGKLPDDRAEQRAWLQAGAARIVDAVREAGSDLVWSFTGPVPAGFWIRRMAHETLVHRADAQLAAGAEPEPVIEARNAEMRDDQRALSPLARARGRDHQHSHYSSPPDIIPPAGLRPIARPTRPDPAPGAAEPSARLTPGWQGPAARKRARRTPSYERQKQRTLVFMPHDVCQLPGR
jgi:uncharacterized protein (TIGR03083 family)